MKKLFIIKQSSDSRRYRADRYIFPKNMININIGDHSDLDRISSILLVYQGKNESKIYPYVNGKSHNISKYVRDNGDIRCINNVIFGYLDAYKLSPLYDLKLFKAIL